MKKKKQKDIFTGEWLQSAARRAEAKQDTYAGTYYKNSGGIRSYLADVNKACGFVAEEMAKVIDEDITQTMLKEMVINQQKEGIKMPLFEVAVIEEPTVKEQEGGAEEQLILKPTAVMAKDDAGAKAAAGQLVDGKITTRMRILVRPFV